MKTLIKKTVERIGGQVFTRDSLPTGVNWLLDIQRGLALNSAPVCFDVGANVGQTVVELRQAFRDARIHAFEPFAEPLVELRRATLADPSVTVVPRAMGSTPGRIDVRPNPQSLMSSLKHRPGQLMDGATESIDIDTVDDYCTRHGIEHIDVLKSDTEGYDLEVLRGAGGMLGRQCVGYVYVEVTFQPGNDQNSPFGPILDLLQGHNYRFLGLYETYPLHFFSEPVVFCNALFVASSVRERSLAKRLIAKGRPN
jgi:FkbM family methyltransferase